MGLDYLNKKVWHPGSMKNIQKVWEVEQQQREINKRARERAKKLMEEQHNDELKRIQVEAGLIPRSHLDRMEWMYDWGNKIQQQKTNQEYLTGQKVAKPGEQKEAKHIFQEEITNKRCQDFQLLHEDPMFEIMRQEKARKDAVVNNPIEMRNIIKELERQYMPQDFHERRQKHFSSKRRKSSESSVSEVSSSEEERKKRQKKHKKHSSKHKHSRSRSRSSVRSSSSRREERSRSREKHSEDRSKSSKSFKQSKLYKEYLQNRFGTILKKDEEGNLKPDYSMHKKKYKTQYQLDEDERKRRTEKLRENAQKLQALRQSQGNKQRVEEAEHDFESGVAKIRSEMMGVVKENRNHKKYRGSDSD